MGSGGKGKVEVQGKSLAGDRARGVVCEGEPVFKVKARVYCMSKRDSKREVERSGGSRSPMAKGNERKLKERSNESKIKMENGNIRRGSNMSINSLNVQESMCPRARDDGRGVAHDVHDTQLTGAMVAQTCGAHQGAGAMLVYFEASRDLQSVNKEIDEDADKGQGRGTSWVGRGQGVSRWRYHHVQ